MEGREDMKEKGKETEGRGGEKRGWRRGKGREGRKKGKKGWNRTGNRRKEERERRI